MECVDSIMKVGFDPKDVCVTLFDRVFPRCASGKTEEEKRQEYDMEMNHPQEILLSEFLRLGSRHIHTLECIWREDNKDKRNTLKRMNLPAASVSCTLYTRKKGVLLSEKIKKYNGLVVMDFDNVYDIENAKKKVAALPYVWYVGLSCSKRGFYAIVPTDNTDYTRHKLYFESICREMEQMGLQVDKQCCDVARLRFISFDDTPVYNDNCIPYTLPDDDAEPQLTELADDGRKTGGKMDSKPLPIAQDLTMSKIIAYCEEWETKRIPLDDYGDWLRLGMALSGYGEFGWSVFDRISKFSGKYNRESNRKTWDSMAGSIRSIGIGSFFYLCHEYGVMPNIKELFDEIPFPVDVFPEDVRKIISSTNECLNFNVDHIASSLLFVASIAIGNSLTVEIKNEWIDKAILYMAIVGKPGTNKSAPLKYAFKPLEERDCRLSDKYEEEKAEYDKANRNAAHSKGCIPEEPKYFQTIMSDFTTEVLIKQHKINPRGIAVYVDELIGFIKNFNKYRSGNDEQVWTQLYNGGSVIVNRMGSQPLNIHDTFIGIIGTIQPGLLYEFAKGKIESGFLDRWLFSYPSTTEYPKLTMEELQPEITESWSNIVNRIFDIPYDGESRTVRLTDDAMRIYTDWFNAMADLKNSDSFKMAEVATKIERYCIRFAIILEALKYGCGKEPVEAISAGSVKGAIDLCCYYMACAIKARRFFRRNPTNSMNELQKCIYSELPIRFSTAEGLEIAIEMGMKERTFKDWIKSDYFRHVCHGQYEKKYE